MIDIIKKKIQFLISSKIIFIIFVNEIDELLVLDTSSIYSTVNPLGKPWRFSLIKDGLMVFGWMRHEFLFIDRKSFMLTPTRQGNERVMWGLHDASTKNRLFLRRTRWRENGIHYPIHRAPVKSRPANSAGPIIMFDSPKWT